MADWGIEPLAKSHDRASFACGMPTLDTFIRTLDGQHQRRRLGKTFVAVEAGQALVRGYYTIAAASVPFASLPAELAKKLPEQRLPALLLGRLAVAAEVQGMKLGGLLLQDALKPLPGVFGPPRRAMWSRWKPSTNLPSPSMRSTDSFRWPTIRSISIWRCPPSRN